MTIGAVSVAEPVPHDLGSTSQAFLAMTPCTLELAMRALERVRGQLRVVEDLDFERISGVTRITLSPRRAEPELPCMNVEVAACTLARSTAVRCAAPAGAIARRRLVTAVTGGLCMSTAQRPSAVIDPGRVPSGRGMARFATPARHLFGELISVRVFMTVSTLPRRHREVVSRSLGAVATAARHRLMPSFERKLGALVLRDREEGGPKSLLVVTG